MTDSTTDGEGWFYTQSGQRKGPVPADELHKLLATQTIDGETPIWRKGLADWQPLRMTEVGSQLNDTPPPIAPGHLNNGFVWMLAVAPIAYLFMDIAIMHYQLTYFVQFVDGNPVYDPPVLAYLTPLTWLIPILTNATLCLIDAAQLKRAGYSSGWMTFFALLLAPAYLFMRAKRLHQTPSYGYAWIASFIVSMIVRIF